MEGGGLFYLIFFLKISSVATQSHNSQVGRFIGMDESGAEA